MNRLLGLIISLLFVNIMLVLILPDQPPEVMRISLPSSPLDGQIQIAFSDAMDVQSFDEAFDIQPQVEGSIVWTGKTVTFTPLSILDFNIDYTVHLLDKVRSQGGLALDQSYLWEFQTPPEELWVLSHEGADYSQLKSISIQDFTSETLFDLPLIVQSFAYDQSLNTIALLAADPKTYQAQEYGSFAVWLYERNLGKLNKLNVLSDAYHYHEVHFLPFEDTLMVTRSKLVTMDDELYLSFQPEEREIVLYHLPTGKSRIITPGAQISYGVYPSPDGRYIKMIDDAGSLVLWDIADGKSIYLENDFDAIFGFSSYGGYMLYTKFGELGPFSEGNMLIAQKFSGVQSMVVSDTMASFFDPSMSTSEQSIVFEYVDLAESDLPVESRQLAMTVIGSGEVEVLTSQKFGLVDSPQFSPSGEYVSFVRFDVDADSGVFSIGWDGYIRDFITAELFLFDVDSREIVPSGVDVAGYQWVW